MRYDTTMRIASDAAKSSQKISALNLGVLGGEKCLVLSFISRFASEPTGGNAVVLFEGSVEVIGALHANLIGDDLGGLIRGQQQMSRLFQPLLLKQLSERMPKELADQVAGA